MVKEAEGQLLWVNKGGVLMRTGENGICLKTLDTHQENKTEVLCRPQMHYLNTYWASTIMQLALVRVRGVEWWTREIHFRQESHQHLSPQGGHKSCPGQFQTLTLNSQMPKNVKGLTSDTHSTYDRTWVRTQLTPMPLQSWQFQRKTITYWVWVRNYWVRDYISKYYASHCRHTFLVLLFLSPLRE